MKRITLLGFAFIFAASLPAQKARYVFYFIADGMGLNHVHTTEMYLGELQGKIGVEPLLFSQFPYVTVATTYSATSGVTDSAAAGTALATGVKTANGMVGLAKDGKTPLTSIARRAKDRGYKVGIATSVAIDDATPAAFYAHDASRYSAYNIGLQLIRSGFDFFAGAGLRAPGEEGKEDLFALAGGNKYAIAKGYPEYALKSSSAERIILIQPDGFNTHGLPYAIDRRGGELTLQEITRAGIDFLARDAGAGFFFMVEGGKIDWCGHSNDAAAMLHEVLDFDEAVKIAYEFYNRYPDETLIVVTADHETGGLAPGNGEYRLNLKALRHQKISQAGYTQVLNELRKTHNNDVSWETIKESLSENFGFWSQVEPDGQQEERLLNVYNETFRNQSVVVQESLYERDEPLSAVAKSVLNEIAMLGWVSGAHSGSYVPVYAIGVGADRFRGKMDISHIPALISEIGGF